MPRHLIGEQGMPPGLLSAVNNHLRTGAGKGRDGERERRRGRERGRERARERERERETDRGREGESERGREIRSCEKL